MFEVVRELEYDASTDTLIDVTPRYPSRLVMVKRRQGFTIEQLKRMEFVRWLYQHGKLVS